MVTSTHKKGEPPMENTPPRARGVSPSKAVRTPEEAMRIAREHPGVKVLASEGHERYGARVKANDIRSGKRNNWKPYYGEVRASALQQNDGTYNVYIYVDPAAGAEPVE